MKCRHCGEELQHIFLDLGSAPPSNAYLSQDDLHKPELWYPLRVFVCEHCWLVQTEDFAQAEQLFSSTYAYFSSFSKSWLEHAQAYAVEMTATLALGPQHMVVEIAANDGYLLQYFQQQNIPCLGVEPTASTAQAAKAKGLDIKEEFFGSQCSSSLVDEGYAADLMIANNVLAHVPDINDFVEGFRILLKPQGVATFEFPHLLELIRHNQFDTIYHEHFSYLSLTAVQKIFNKAGLSIFNVQQLATHGGSLRVFAQRSDNRVYPISDQVQAILDSESACKLTSLEGYSDMQQRAEQAKFNLLRFILEAYRYGEKIAAYGAAAKGNTLLNYSGIRADMIRYVVDRNPAKQGQFMPGSRIPIVDETCLQKDKPHWVIVLPWNIQQEIQHQLQYIKDWGGRLVTLRDTTIETLT